MSSRRRLAIAVAPAFLVVVLVILGAPLSAIQRNEQKPDKARLEEAQAVRQAVDLAQSGSPLPADIPISIESYHFFKTARGQTYVPFTLVVDASSLADPAVTLLFRAVNKSTGATQETSKATDQEKKDSKDKKSGSAAAAPTYQDLAFVTLSVQGGKARLSRAVEVGAGTFDVYVAIKERNPAEKKKPKIAVLRQEITAPDFSSDGLATSSVIVSDRVEQLQAPLKAEQQRENRYTVGLMRLFPLVGTAFAKNQELTVYFQIYNPALDSTKKPDVLVEYGFYQKLADKEKNIFNDEPSVLNASTLPNDFDVAKSNLANGRAWPLDKFPTGSYRLEVKITDKLSGKVITKSVSFSVA